MSPTDKPLKLVAYVRVSTEDQASNGVSIDAQQDRISAYAVACGHEIVATEIDAGVSGCVVPEKRAGLLRALAHIKSRGADGILVYKIDRLSRSVEDTLRLVKDAKRRQWHLVSVCEHIDTSTAFGKFVLDVLASLAEMERNQISERTQMALGRVAREGRARSGRLPFGWRLGDRNVKNTTTAGGGGKLVAYEPEQKILRSMLALKANGFGAWRIARTLNERGEHNPRTARVWSFGTVAAILRTYARRKRAMSSQT
jgi:DNA invertase Pin-like site-specific DNA recombinase